MPAVEPRAPSAVDEVGPLIGRLAAGDEEAARELVRRVGRLALPVAAAVLGGRERAEDVVQEIVIDALRGLGSLREPERFEAWVHRIAVRHARRALRARWLRRSREQAVEEVALASPGAGPEHALAVREEVRSALLALPPRQRIAIVLRYVHGLTDAEIADALGCRTGSAASLLSRGRAALRVRLRPGDPTDDKEGRP